MAGGAPETGPIPGASLGHQGQLAHPETGDHRFHPDQGAVELPIGEPGQQRVTRFVQRAGDGIDQLRHGTPERIGAVRGHDFDATDDP